MFIHMYVYVRAKKIIQRERETWHKRGGGGVYGLKQSSIFDYLRNRWTRGQKERDLICLQIMPKKILGMKEWQYTSILDCKNQLHTGQYTNGLMVRNF